MRVFHVFFLKCLITPGLANIFIKCKHNQNRKWNLLFCLLHSVKLINYVSVEIAFFKCKLSMADIRIRQLFIQWLLKRTVLQKSHFLLIWFYEHKGIWLFRLICCSLSIYEIRWKLQPWLSMWHRIYKFLWYEYGRMCV